MEHAIFNTPLFTHDERSGHRIGYFVDWVRYILEKVRKLSFMPPEGVLMLSPSSTQKQQMVDSQTVSRHHRHRQQTPHKNPSALTLLTPH
jgi:hypothetical protein